VIRTVLSCLPLATIKMKVTNAILLFFFATASNAQMHLDTSKLALFGKEKISSDLILQADSLLISAVEYYNNRISRGYSLISLSESQYLEYLKLDSLNQFIKPYLTKKGKTKKCLLKKLPQKETDRVLDIIAQKDNIKDSLDYLKDVGKPNREDSLVSFWGGAGRIDVQNYYRQYQYWFDKDGNCQIRASCFCSDMIETLKKTPEENRINWKKMPLKVHDGGSCVFTISLDLENNRASRMHVNGI
jgi:hypothetical protein